MKSTETTKKQINTVYLVAQYLLDNDRSYIHDIKRTCKANNPMNRVMALRRTFGWEISTVLQGYEGRTAIYYYQVEKQGKMPQKMI
jgi:hypothetical protein